MLTLYYNLCDSHVNEVVTYVCVGVWIVLFDGVVNEIIILKVPIILSSYGKFISRVVVLMR